MLESIWVLPLFWAVLFLYGCGAAATAALFVRWCEWEEDDSLVAISGMLWPLSWPLAGLAFSVLQCIKCWVWIYKTCRGK